MLRGLPHIAEKLFAMGATSWCVCDATRINARPSHAKYPSAACTVEICDVSDHEDVKALADRLGELPVDTIIKNAAVAPKPRLETRGGIERP